MGTQPLSPKRVWSPPIFSAHVYCGQPAGWIKMTLGMEVGLSSGNFVLDGDPAPSPKRGGALSPIFGKFLLCPNGWMHHNATWYGGRPQPRGLCVRWGPIRPSPKGGTAPDFWPMSVVAQPHSMKVGLEPGDIYCVRWGPSTLPKRGTASPNFQPMSVVDKRARWIKIPLGMGVVRR